MFESSQWRGLTRHPLSEAFGDMSEVEFESLLADMTQHGYDTKQQVIVFQGKVLDGWHRQRAGVMANKSPTYDEFKGTEDEAELLVVRRNLNRRHLDVSQRGLIAGRFATMKHGGDRKSKNQAANLPLDPPHKTQGKVAEEFNISERTARDGKKVAINGTPQLQQAVMEKTISVSDASKIADEPAKVQNEAVKKVESGKARTVKEAVTPKVEQPSLAEGEIPNEPDDGKVDCPHCHGTGRITKDATVFPKELDTEEFRTAWGEWQDHRREKRVKLTPKSIKMQLEQLRVAGVKVAIQTIKASITNGYTGLFTPKAGSSNGRISRVEAPAGKYDKIGETVGPGKTGAAK